MSTRPANNSSENTNLSRNDVHYGPGRALATGLSGPTIRPLSAAELAAQGSATNFNTYHDELGRFTTSDGAVAPGQTTHLNYTGEPTKQEKIGGTTQGQTPNISGHAFDSENLATCVAASIRSIIAAMYPTKNVPNEEAIKAQIVAVAKTVLADPKEKIDWNNGVSAFPSHLAAIVQKVLENNGVQTTAQLSYGSVKEMAAAIMTSKQPAIVNVQREGAIEQHSVAVQWDTNAVGEGQGRFLINNVTAKGETQAFTREQFERGQITANIKRASSIQTPKMMHYSVKYTSPTIFAKAP